MSYIGNEPIVSATRTITEVVATAGQTTFTANGGYTVGFIDVFVNGAQLQTSDFTATNGSTITLGTGATIGDDIRLVAWGTFNTSNTYTQAVVDSTFVRRDATMVNKIINGCMRVDQRNSGASVSLATDNTYTLDRWTGKLSAASKYSIQQSTVAPAGFTNSLKVTSLSSYSVASGDLFTVKQVVEGLNIADLAWGTASAKPIQISFWAYSSLTGNFGASVWNYDGSRSYPVSFTISSANTWTQISVTIPGDTSGTWLTTNGVGLNLGFSLGCGATWSGTANTWAGTQYIQPTGSVSVVGTSGATFYITGVDLRKGSYTTAPTFDMRQYGQEEMLCKRYYEHNYTAGNVPGTATTTGLKYSSGNVGAVTTSYLSDGFLFQVPKRAIPTVNTWDNAGNSGKVNRESFGVGSTNNIATNISNIGTSSALVYCTGASASSMSYFYSASAEL